MKLAPVKDRVAALFGAIFRPRPRGSIADWAAGKHDGRPNIMLSNKESGDFPGPYDPELNPLPTVLFDVFQSGEYRKAVFKKSSQSGVTLAVLILICYFVVVYTRNFLYVIDSLDEMRRLSRERLRPMLQSCRAAAGQIPEDEGEMQTLTLSLRGCVGYLTGAFSLGALSNKSVGLAVYDEVDAHPVVGKEGDEAAVDLAGERGKKQTGFFEVFLSKPIDWDGRINQEYLHGTRHKCHVPCPHCGTYQELIFERLQFEHCRDENGRWQFGRLPGEVFYRCISEECQAGPAAGRIEESHKAEMVRRRRWKQTNFGQDDYQPTPEVFSCELTDMYSTFPTAAWCVLVREWIESEGKPSKRQRFLRGRLARAKEKRKVETRAADIMEMRGEYRRGQCPVQPDIVLMYVDTQDVEKKWLKCAFTLADDACFVVDWGSCLSYGDALAAADVPVDVLKWRPETPEAERINPTVYQGLLDEGFRQKEVRAVALSTILPGRLPDGSPAFRFHTCFGRGGMQTAHLKDLVVPRLGEPPNATHSGVPIHAYRYSDDNFKNELYNLRIGGARDVRQALKEGRKPPAGVPPMWFPSDIPPDVVSEFCQERLVWNPKVNRWEWPDCKNPNDYGDGAKGCLVGWYIVKPALVLARAGRPAPA